MLWLIRIIVWRTRRGGFGQMRSSSIVEGQMEGGGIGEKRKRGSVIEWCREQSSLEKEV